MFMDCPLHYVLLSSRCNVDVLIKASSQMEGRSEIQDGGLTIVLGFMVSRSRDIPVCVSGLGFVSLGPFHGA